MWSGCSLLVLRYGCSVLAVRQRGDRELKRREDYDLDNIKLYAGDTVLILAKSDAFVRKWSISLDFLLATRIGDVLPPVR